MASWTEIFVRSPEDDVTIEGIPVVLKAWQPTTNGSGSSISDYKKSSGLYTKSDPCGVNEVLYNQYGNLSTRTLVSSAISTYTNLIPVLTETSTTTQ